MTDLSITQQITFIYVKNLKRSAIFYENIMGFKLWLDQRKCKIYQITTDGYLGICQSRDHNVIESTKNDIIFTIVTSEVDRWYTILSDKGVEFDKSPEINHDFNIYHCFLKDPDGYVIEIQMFIDNN